MEYIEMLTILVPLAVSITATGLIYDSWRNRERTPAAGAGWLLAIVSFFAWSRTLGPEFGVSYAIIVLVCLVWVIITLTRESAGNESQSAERPYRTMNWPGMQDCFKHGVLFLLSVPVTGVIAMMLTVALVTYLPWTMPVKVAVVIFAYPVLWGGLSAWICAQDKLLKPVLASAGIFAVSGLVLFA